MKIAYLLLCHSDPAFVARLSRKLTVGNADAAVFVHVDQKSAMYDDLRQQVAGAERVYFSSRRVAVYWGGFSMVEAMLELMRQAFNQGDYQRFVMIQGADYPIKSKDEIDRFFTAHRNTEFIKALDVTVSKNPYFYSRSRYRLYADRPTFAKKMWNRLTRLLDLKLHSGHLKVAGQDWHVYWGCAQFALTRACVGHVLQYADDEGLRRYFAGTFAPDELFFHTLIANSPFRERLSEGGVHAETPGLRLVDMRNLCYFEYPGPVTTFALKDFERLRQVPELYIRKVTSSASTPLLDRIDAMHADATTPARAVGGRA